MSLNKHGAEAAVQEVCRFRYNGLEELHGEANPYPSWERLYNEIARTVGDEYDLQPLDEQNEDSDEGVTLRSAA